jgi:hypothetical protein
MMNTNEKGLTALGVGVLIWASTGAAAYAGGLVDTTFHKENFPDSSATIDNPYWPLPEGTTFVFRTVGKDGCEVNPVEVTNVTPTIDGITTRQVHDRVYEDDNCNGGKDFLSEDTLDWYAQDIAGNIWYLGEDTKEYCNRDHPDVVCSTEGSFVAGENGAAPGIIMLANPTAGDFYQQESAEGAQDMAKVLTLNAKVALTFPNRIDPDNYTGCLETKEWSPLEAGAIEHKYYCPGTGKGLLLDDEFHPATHTELVDIVQSQ